jgi:hypothetical protein
MQPVNHMAIGLSSYLRDSTLGERFLVRSPKESNCTKLKIISIGERGSSGAVNILQPIGVLIVHRTDDVGQSHLRSQSCKLCMPISGSVVIV